MIRGVNRQIIEINDTQSDYFERAIFFVKPDCNVTSTSKLHDEAISIVERSASQFPVRNTQRKKRRISRRVLWLLIFAFACISAVLSVMQFVH